MAGLVQLPSHQRRRLAGSELLPGSNLERSLRPETGPPSLAAGGALLLYGAAFWPPCSLLLLASLLASPGASPSSAV